MIDEKRKSEIDELLNKIDLTCHDYGWFDLALTHSSYTFENKLTSLENNERLEFLGDAVLKLVTSDYLYERFPNYTEGELTKIRAILVSDNVLTKLAKKINLGKYLQIGFHEEKAGGRNRPSTLACAFEALLGAVYLDGKLPQLNICLIPLIEDEVTEIDESDSKFNYKAILQEYAQGQGMGLPEYMVVKEEGPPHEKIFSIEVIVNDEVCGFGSGKSKKEAQQIAAQVAVETLNVFGEEK